MKVFLTIALLLLVVPSWTVAQERARHEKPLTRNEIKEPERLLFELGYWTGPVDGVFDPGSRSALIAFQKWTGRPITAKLTRDEIAAIRASESPKARETGYGHVE